MKPSTMAANGRVVIPAEIRRRHHLKPGTRISFHEKGGEIYMTFLTVEMIRANAGFLRKCGTTKGSLLRALAKEKRREREL
jgi:AbrB family looped-hinge helix DNA binding protein